MAKGGAIRAGRAYVELYADNNPLVRGLKMAERRMRAFGNKMKALGSQMTMAGLAGTAPAAISVKWFAQFDDSMRAVKAITGATADEFERLTEKAKALGRSTSYTAADVANAMTELGRAGFAPTEIDAAIAGMLDLARATGTELPLAAQIAAATLRGFGLEAGEMAMAADVLVATANNSAQTLEDLGESMKYVAPIASEAGMTLQDTSKALGVLANMGIKGSMAGTSLRQIMLSLTNTDTQKTLREIGVESLNAAGGMRKTGDVLLELGKALAGMPNAERLSLMKNLFDQRAVTSAVKLSSEQFARLNEAIDNATGLASSQAKEMDAGVGGAFRRLLSATQDVALSIGKALAPSLMRLADVMTEVANRVSSFVAGNEELVLTVTGVSAGLLILGPIVSGLGTLMVAGAAGVGALATAIGLIATPVGGAVLLLASLGREGSLTGRAVAEAGDTITSHFAALKSTVDEVFGAMSDAIATGDMQLAMQAMVAGIKLELLRLQDIWQSFWENLPGMGGDDKAWMDRLNAITAAENELTRITRQAEEQRMREAEVPSSHYGAHYDAMAEEQTKAVEQVAEQSAPATGGGALPGTGGSGWLSSLAEQYDEHVKQTKTTTPSKTGMKLAEILGSVGGFIADASQLDPAALLQGIGQFIGEASQAVPEFVADTAITAAEWISPEAELVSQIQRSARGTFSSLAAGRMGAVGSSTNRTERQLDKLVASQAHANRRLDQFVDLASKAKLVFTGALPG